MEKNQQGYWNPLKATKLFTKKTYFKKAQIFY